MKLYNAFIVGVGLTVLVGKSVAHGKRLSEHDGDEAPKERALDGADCPFSQLFSYLNLGQCLVVSGEGRHSDVQLGRDCSSICPPDEDGLMRKEGTQLCLQASHGSVVRDGSKMRLYPCDKNNELQQFTWTDDSDPHPFVLKSPKYSDYCVTSRGVNARPGDPIILKVRDDLRPVERQFWWGD